MVAFVQALLESQLNLTSGLAAIAAPGLVILAAITAGAIATVGARWMLVRLAKRLAMRTESQWGDVLIESGAVGRLAPLAAVFTIYPLRLVFGGAKAWIDALLLVYVVAIVLRVIDALLDAGIERYARRTGSSGAPLRDALRIGRVGVAVLATIFVAATTLPRSQGWVVEEFEAVLRADRADDAEDIPALIESVRKALESVRDQDGQFPARRANVLREIRERGPALVEAAALRAAEIAEEEQHLDGPIDAAPGDRGGFPESLRELCGLVTDAGITPDREKPEVAPEAGWGALAESCRRIDAALAMESEKPATQANPQSAASSSK